MQVLVFITLACVATSALAAVEHSCYSNRGENVIQFNGRNQDVFFPCKYWALRQQKCGKYLINLSPGNRWVVPKHQLDTLWLGLTNTETNQEWEGRTTNKLAVKYVNSEGARTLFTKRDGTIRTQEEYVFGKDVERHGVYIEDKDQTFRVTFIPWDPSNRAKYPNADFIFECNHKETLNEYPVQLCGGSGKMVVQRRTEEEPFSLINLPEKFRENVIYYDVFTDPDIVQTNPKCDVATNLLTNLCQTDEQRIHVISNCKDILHSRNHRDCIASYTCEPIDAFNACLQWGCNGTAFDPDNKRDCIALAEGIDGCPEMKSRLIGNITDRITAANCYKEFLAIIPELLP